MTERSSFQRYEIRMKDKVFEEIDAMLQEKSLILWRPHFDEKYHKFNDEYTIY